MDQANSIQVQGSLGGLPFFLMGILLTCGELVVVKQRQKR